MIFPPTLGLRIKPVRNPKVPYVPQVTSTRRPMVTINPTFLLYCMTLPLSHLSPPPAFSFHFCQCDTGSQKARLWHLLNYHLVDQRGELRTPRPGGSGSHCLLWTTTGPHHPRNWAAQTPPIPTVRMCLDIGFVEDLTAHVVQPFHFTDTTVLKRVSTCEIETCNHYFFQ